MLPHLYTVKKKSELSNLIKRLRIVVSVRHTCRSFHGPGVAATLLLSETDHQRALRLAKARVSPWCSFAT